MPSLLIGTVLLLCATARISTSTTPYNRDTGLLFDSFPGYALSFPTNSKGLKKTTTKVPDKMSCVFKCVEVCWCVSVNLRIKSAKTGLHVCELLSTDKYSSKKMMKKDKNSNHLSVKNPCETEPCRNGGTCIFLDNRQDYQCRCAKGFKGWNCETDIDECRGSHGCHSNAKCVNKPGTYKCICNGGYAGDGRTCNDIDECTSGTHNCPDHSTCQNTPGSFDCACNAGYRKYGYKCVPELEKSDILSSNSNYYPTLSRYLGPVLQNPSTSHWVRCWHATSDGWDVTTKFHRQCDGKGPTVTIVRVGQYVFGGYTDVPWYSNNVWVTSTKSFLYSLNNINGNQPTKLNLIGNDNDDAVFRYSTYGPTFGGGHDLHISNDASRNKGSYTAPHTYHIPSGCSYNVYCSFFAGASPFTPSDVEVFYETTN